MSCCGSGTVTHVTYAVSGMTCGHCEKSVSEEVSAIPGVTAVSADAKAGTVTVTATGRVDEAALRAAIEEAGYELGEESHP